MVRRFWSSNDFDSVLYHPSFRNISALTLLVRVHLNAFNPSQPGKKEEQFFRRDSANPNTGKMFTFLRWQPKEWEDYKAGYKREVEYYLNWPIMGLWLRPDSLGREESHAELREFKSDHPLSPRFGAVVQCGVSITLVDKPEQSHVSYDVLRLKDGQPKFRAYDINDFNARDTGMITNQSLQSWPPPSGTLPHSTVAHEFGHSLNLDHSNINDPRCVQGGERICYGAPGSPQSRNLMGRGWEITKANALPWLRAIYRHSRELLWYATDQLPMETHMLR
jgi:hypothetical protein